MPARRTPESLPQLLEWLAHAPAGTTLDAGAVHEMLSELAAPLPEAIAAPAADVPTWRSRLWTVPADTRLLLPEAAEALGRSRSWLYKRTGPKSRERVPCRRLDGELVFLAGELRRWIQDHEEIIEAGSPERLSLRAG
jgi:predicted DNA-binding transcriptional regulator AlpA